MNSKGTPKVSIIIPLFNQKQFVGEAIESILNQTCKNIEIIVVNDGSTDDPIPTLKKYNDKIILINQENKGLAAARNAGIRRAGGEYIQFLDADDFLNSDKIKQQVEFNIHENCDISYCEVEQYHDETGHRERRHVGEIKDMFPHLYNFWNIYPLPVHSMIIRKDIFSKFGVFDEELTACEDRFFFSRLSASGVRFRYFPYMGGVRRLHEKSMNKNRLHIIKNTIEFYIKINNELGDRYFVDKFAYTGHEMMKANLTYIYATYTGEGACKSELRQIKGLLNENKLKFFADPIPGRMSVFKLQSLIISAHLRRWRSICRF